MEDRRCFPCDQPIIEEHPPCPNKCNQPSCTTYKKKVPVDFTVYPIIWVVGGHGSGKGVQCSKIRAKYGFTTISSGDLLREQIAKKTVIAKCLIDILGRGGLVPNKTVLDLILAKINSVQEPTGFVIEGYPRERTQGPAFEKFIGPVSLILYLEMTDQTLVKKCIEHGLKKGRCHKNPDVTMCDPCNINEEHAQIILKTFHENVALILDLYTERVQRINAERGEEAVFSDIKNAIDNLLRTIKAKVDADNAAAVAAAYAAANPGYRFLKHKLV